MDALLHINLFEFNHCRCSRLVSQLQCVMSSHSLRARCLIMQLREFLKKNFCNKSHMILLAQACWISSRSMTTRSRQNRQVKRRLQKGHISFQQAEALFRRPQPESQRLFGSTHQLKAILIPTLFCSHFQASVVRVNSLFYLMILVFQFCHRVNSEQFICHQG